MAATERPLEGAVTSSREVRVVCVPPSINFMLKGLWFILEPLPLEVVGILSSQTLGVLPNIGAI